jgi:hypothetical protein
MNLFTRFFVWSAQFRYHVAAWLLGGLFILGGILISVLDVLPRFFHKLFG